MAISDIVKNAGERQLRELAEAGVREKQALRGVREHAVKTMGEVIGTAEAGVTAFGFGYLRGRYAAAAASRNLRDSRRGQASPRPKTEQRSRHRSGTGRRATSGSRWLSPAEWGRR